MATRPTSRRAFLESIGRAAGGSAMLKAMAALGIGAGTTACGSASGSSGGGVARPNDPAPPPSPPATPTNSYPTPSDWPPGIGAGTSVIILGAGIAGMSAAWELGKLGYDCTLLEARASAGGRCRTLRSGDVVEELDSTQFCEFDDDPELYFNPGPARIPHHHEFILGYCREFGVALELFSNDNRAGRVHSGQALDGEPELQRRILADSNGHIADLLANAVDQGALDQELSTVDKNRLLAMLRQFGDLDGDNRYRGSDRAGYPGQEDAGDTKRDQSLPPLSLDDIVDSNFWETQLYFSEGINQQATMLQAVGGMDNIVRAFETRVGEDVIYEARVSGIRNTGSGVEVDYDQAGAGPATLAADYCICTIPATVLRSINNNFSAGHRDAIDSFEYSQSGKLAFQSRRFWEQDHNIYGGISWTDQDITQLWYPSNTPGRGQGVVLGAYTFGERPGTRFANRSPQQRIDATISEAARVHPEFSIEVRSGISVSWPKVEFQLGAWGLSDPGILREADGQVYFAGEHVSSLQGWQEGAVQSAYRAIDGIVQRDQA
jgi:monoamine oxidase